MLRGVVRDSVVIALISLILEYLSSSTGLLSVFVESMSQSLQISLGYPLEENTQLISTIGKLKGCCDEGTQGANICGTLITYGHQFFLDCVYLASHLSRTFRSTYPMLFQWYYIACMRQSLHPPCVAKRFQFALVENWYMFGISGVRETLGR